MTEAIQAQDYDELVKILKGIGLSPASYRGPSGNLLHVITAFGPVTFIPRLLADGLDINETNGEGETALHIAARSGRSVVLDQLLANPLIDDTIANAAGLTPYQVAKNRQIATAIEYARSLYINRKTQEMHGMAARGEVDGLRQLLAVNRNRVVLNVNAPDAHGDTILHVAAKLGHPLEFVQLCLELGCDPYLKNKKGKLALELAKDEPVRTALKEGKLFCP